MKLRQIKSIIREKQLCLRKIQLISTLHDHNYYVVLEEKRTYNLPVILTAFKIMKPKKANEPDFTPRGFLPAFCNYRIFLLPELYILQVISR